MGKHKFTPVDLSSFILKSLKEDAEAALGQPVTQAVISVPAYFNDIQRKATLSVAQLAGLKVSRLVNEPTAAALAYGLHDKDGESTFLIIDLGGGTFDVSILEMFSSVMEVRSSVSDAFLGGEDYTAALAKEFCRQLGVEPDKLSKEDQGRIRRL
jgi:molecular chaperone HscC